MKEEKKIKNGLAYIYFALIFIFLAIIGITVSCAIMAKDNHDIAKVTQKQIKETEEENRILSQQIAADMIKNSMKPQPSHQNWD